jgi:preprotein translocase SecE subunit
MARNRQRAKDRKRKNQDNGQPDEAEGVVRPSLSKGDGAGAPPSDVDLDNDFEDDDDDEPVAPVPVGVVGTEASTPVRKQQGSKLINFLRACWAELQRVQWPDRRQVGQATAVVLGFVLIAGAFLGLADVAAKQLVDLIL